jgi:hypothetical protein
VANHHCLNNFFSSPILEAGKLTKSLGMPASGMGKGDQSLIVTAIAEENYHGSQIQNVNASLQDRI